MSLGRTLFLGGLLTASVLAVYGEQAVLAQGTYIGPYGRSLGGKQGKNIYAWDDETLIVVYCGPSADPNNPYYLWVAYSFDSGEDWQTGSIGPGPANRVYPGVVCPRDTLWPYLAYQHALHDGVAYVSSDIYFSKDEFFPLMLYTPIWTGTANPDYHGWFPSIVTTPQGDTVLISWGNTVSGIVTGNCYLKRDFNGGWGYWPEPEILMVDTQGNPEYDDADGPRMVIGEGGYIFALFNWEPTGTDRWVPFYIESMDYGATWSQPDTVFPDWPPYPDATCWWYCFDAILDPDDNYRPYCTVRLATGNYELGDVWEIHPTQGSPGYWSDWTPTVLSGDGRGAPFATTPSIGRDPWGNLHVVYEKLFVSGSDTVPDIGYRCSTDGGATWAEELRITATPDTECPLELADNVFNHLYMLWEDSLFLKYPNPVVGVEEKAKSQLPMTHDQLLQSYPNPFSRSTVIRYAIPDMGYGIEEYQSHITLVVYDLAGRLVKTLVDEPLPTPCSLLPTSVVWDGRDNPGCRVAAGIYLYRLDVGGVRVTKKLVVLR